MGPPLVYDSHVSLEKYFFFVAPVIDAIIPTRTYVGKRTCAHPFSTWHAIVSQLSSLSTRRYTTRVEQITLLCRGGFRLIPCSVVGIPLSRKPIWSLLSGQG